MKKLCCLFSLFVLFAAPRQAAAVPVVSANGIVNNASFAPGTNALAPGTLAAIFGTGLNDGSQNSSSSFVNGKLATTLGGASVTFNGIPAPMFSSFPSQLNVQVPLELAGVTSAQVIVTVGGQQSVPQTVSIGTASPGIFTVGNQQGAILIANTSIFVANSGSIPGVQSRAANPGEFITIFATGLGAVNNPPATGAAGSGQTTVDTPQVSIGGVQATVSFSGLAPGFVALSQVNVQVPQQGVGGGFVPVVMSIGGKQSNIAMIAVSGNGGGANGAFCSGFSLTGTATSLTGTIPSNCLFPPGIPSTGGVPVSLTGVVSGTQTVYSGNVSGNGTAQCATGSTGNWTANFSLTININPTVASLATSGGVLSGNSRTGSGSMNLCGSTQVLNGIQAFSFVTGSVNAGGAATVNIGGPMGMPPIVERGNAQSLNSVVPGTIITSLLTNNSSATASVSMSVTGATSGNQTVYTGSGAGGGIMNQCPGGSGTWTATVSNFSATVTPTVASVATGGGTVSGNWSMSVSGTVCGATQSQNVSGTVAGTVSPGGGVTLTLVIGNTGGGGHSNPLILTGTATSISGTLLGPDLFDSKATGSVPLTGTGTSTSSQTIYTLSGSGSGTGTCDDGSTGNWSISITATLTLTPAIPSLAASGGSVTVTGTHNVTGTFCGSPASDQGTDTGTGTVSPGGAVKLSL